MPIDLESVRKKIIEEREQLLARSIPAPEVAHGDEADLAAMAQAKEQYQWLANDQKARLAEIDKVLVRIESGKYGICDSCSKPIAPERMEANPHATMCIDCQSKLEKKPGRKPQGSSLK
ncbi:MAG: TraR/DksA family transcriptional regulator [Chloroflexi bacterium]|nr:TraR/DksA family transcriptional regulator [Chloroflexota bacterium]